MIPALQIPGRYAEAEVTVVVRRNNRARDALGTLQAGFHVLLW